MTTSKKKFGEMYDETLQEWTSDFMKVGAHKVGAVGALSAGIIASTAGLGTIPVSVTAVAAYLLGYGNVWLADKIITRDLRRKEANLKLQMSIDRYKESPLFANEVRKKMKDPTFRKKMDELKKKYAHVSHVTNK